MEAVSSLGDVVVLGLGQTGLGVAEYLSCLPKPRVSSVTLYGGATSVPSDRTQALEQAGVRVVCGTEQIEGSYDLAIVSPGIPFGSPFFASAQAHATRVIGEPEFAWSQSPERWVAITGTNGKTTTTLLTTQILKVGGLAAQAIGNVGTLATSRVGQRDNNDWFVAELSSFQLATTERLHPRVACLLNVTPDHLEWHGSMEEYARAKERVFANMDAGDLAIVSEEDEWCRRAIERLEKRGLRVCHLSVHGAPNSPCAAYLSDGRLEVRLDGVEHSLVLAQNLPIRGEHNVQNALAAAAVALELGISGDAVSHGLLSFRPLEHRIEPCKKTDGVLYVNDSKATNVDSVEKALTAFVPGRVVVLLGGHDKGTELYTLAHAVSARCKAAICYGEAGPRIAEALRVEDDNMGLVIREAPHMREALLEARSIAQEGDVVLLSPACSSFDEFANYQQRGKVFKQMVDELDGQGTKR